LFPDAERRRPCRFRDFLEERRMNMRMLASAVAAAALMGTASLAYAATATGQITDINQTKHLIALDTGSNFMVPDRTDLSTFKVGEEVTLAYEGGDGMKMASSIRSQAGPAFFVGGGLFRVAP
jgi:opacity protein-like surface antigen